MARTSNNCLVVFSGGQDSTTCLYWARAKFKNVLALTFNYQQKHILELTSAKKIAKLTGVKHIILKTGNVFGGNSPLVNPKFKVKKTSLNEVTKNELQDTFVPGRNILFLSLAGSVAYINNISDIVIGVSQEDYGGYPDCRQAFINSMQETLSTGLAKNITLHTPLINLNKRQTVELAQSIPECFEALGYSTTCYNGVFPPCNTCHACVLRAKGFKEAQSIDPLISRSLIYQNI